MTAGVDLLIGDVVGEGTPAQIWSCRNRTWQKWNLG